MHTTNADSIRYRLGHALAPVFTLLLLSTLALPAEAQHGRGGHSGRGGSGHPGYGQGGHHGGHGGYGHGYRHRGDSGHRGYAGYRSYRGHYGYPSYRSSYAYRPHDARAYYRGAGSWGFGYYGSPGVSFYYDASPRYYGASPRTVVYRRDQASEPAYYRYLRSVAAAEAAVADSGEAYDASSDRAFDARPEPARVKLEIEPGDASVYLDGRFLGLAAELPAELWIDPGSHRLEVARPGYADRSLDLDLEPGEELEIDGRLEVETQAPDRRR